MNDIQLVEIVFSVLGANRSLLCYFQFSSNRAHKTTTSDRIYLLQIEIHIISEDSNLACQHDKGGREPIMIKDLGKKYENTKENTYMILQIRLKVYFLSKMVSLIYIFNTFV